MHHLFSSADCDKLEAEYSRLTLAKNTFQAITALQMFNQAVNKMIVDKMTFDDNEVVIIPCHKDDMRFHDVRGS